MMFMPKERQRRVEPSFALSETFTAPEPAYVSPVPTNAPGYGTIRHSALLGPGTVLIQWANWPTNTPYRIEVSLTLKEWKEFASGTSSSTSGVISILDGSMGDFPVFFYRIVAP